MENYFKKLININSPYDNYGFRYYDTSITIIIQRICNVITEEW